MKFDYDFIIKYTGSTKEEYEFIKSLIDKTYIVMLDLISRKLEYQSYNEIHRINNDYKIYVDEDPIDSSQDIHIYYLDNNLQDTSEIETLNYIIDPQNNAYIKLKSGAGDSFNLYDIENSFYSKPRFVRIEYTGGYEDLPSDLVLLLSMLTKFFYTNRDPGITQYRGEQLTKVISDYNPEILRIIGAWKCHHI